MYVIENNWKFIKNSNTCTSICINKKILNLKGDNYIRYIKPIQEYFFIARNVEELFEILRLENKSVRPFELVVFMQLIQKLVNIGVLKEYNSSKMQVKEMHRRERKIDIYNNTNSDVSRIIKTLNNEIYNIEIKYYNSSFDYKIVHGSLLNRESTANKVSVVISDWRNLTHTYRLLERVMSNAIVLPVMFYGDIYTIGPILEQKEGKHVEDKIKSMNKKLINRFFVWQQMPGVYSNHMLINCGNEILTEVDSLVSENQLQRQSKYETVMMVYNDRTSNTHIVRMSDELMEFNEIYEGYYEQ